MPSSALRKDRFMEKNRLPSTAAWSAIEFGFMIDALWPDEECGCGLQNSNWKCTLLTPEPRQQWGEGEAGQVVRQFNFVEFQDDERDAEHEQAGGGVDGIEQCVFRQPRLCQSSQQRQRALAGNDWDDRQDCAPAKSGHERHRRQ